MAEKVPGWLERLLLPRLSSIEGELKAVNARIDSLESTLNARIDSLESKIDERTKALDVKLEAVRNEVRNLAEKIDVVRDIERLKVEVAELKTRVGSTE